MKEPTMKSSLKLLLGTLALFAAATAAGTPASAQAKKPNILFSMGDDIGYMQPSGNVTVTRMALRFVAD